MKTFTVTIAGTERFDGEAPYTWVVEAADMASAVNKAMAFHVLSQDQELSDLELERSLTFEGLPPENCGYHWNDLRTAALPSAGARLFSSETGEPCTGQQPPSQRNETKA